MSNKNNGFVVGDSVYCLLNGYGVVVAVPYEGGVIVEIKEENDIRIIKYDENYKLGGDTRLLYYSKPVINGGTERPVEQHIFSGDSIIIQYKEFGYRLINVLSVTFNNGYFTYYYNYNGSSYIFSDDYIDGVTKIIHKIMQNGEIVNVKLNRV